MARDLLYTLARKTSSGVTGCPNKNNAAAQSDEARTANNNFRGPVLQGTISQQEQQVTCPAPRLPTTTSPARHRKLRTRRINTANNKNNRRRRCTPGNNTNKLGGGRSAAVVVGLLF
jgi:hypothetical protein